jgi:hypothetical protein
VIDVEAMRARGCGERCIAQQIVLARGWRPHHVGWPDVERDIRSAEAALKGAAK